MRFLLLALHAFRKIFVRCRYRYLSRHTELVRALSIMCSRGYTAASLSGPAELVRVTRERLVASAMRVHPHVLWACGGVALNRTLADIAAAAPAGKRILVYIVDDYEHTLYRRSERLFVVRTSLHRSLKTSDEAVLPYIFDSVPRMPLLRKASSPLPIVGFCGRNNSHRAPLLHELSLHSGAIVTLFEAQNVKVWTKRMSSPARATAFKAFQDNMRDSHFTVSTRGAGNFAAGPNMLEPRKLYWHSKVPSPLIGHRPPVGHQTHHDG